MIILDSSDVATALSKMNVDVAFTDAEREAFKTIPVVKEEGRMLAFPTPVSESLHLKTLKDAAERSPSLPLLRIFDHAWYAEEPFYQEICSPGWHVLQMDVAPDSLYQQYNYLDSIPDRGLTVPSAVEIALMIFIHHVLTGQQLLHRKHSWTATHASLGRIVTVGAFGRNGLFLSGHPAGYASRGLGICGKAKIGPPPHRPPLH